MTASAVIDGVSVVAMTVALFAIPWFFFRPSKTRNGTAIFARCQVGAGLVMVLCVLAQWLIGDTSSPLWLPALTAGLFLTAGLVAWLFSARRNGPASEG